MAKKKLPVSIFEIVWYTICALIILWGITYVTLSLIDKYNDLKALHDFASKFQSTFGLSLYFWGLIIIAIGVVAAVIVMIVFAKTYDRAADREQRRSARLNAIKKDQKVVSEQQPEVVEQPAQVEEKPQEQPQEEVKEEPAQEEQPVEPQAEEQQAEEPVQEAEQSEETPAEEAAPVEEPAEEQPAEEPVQEAEQPEEAPVEEQPVEQPTDENKE